MLRTYVRDITRRRFMTARRYASAEYAVVERPSVCLSVRPPVRPSQAGIISKRLDESSWFWHGRFLPCLPYGNLGISKNWGTSLWNFVSNSELSEISPWKVDRVVNRTRRRSSLLTTPIYATVDESWLFTTSRSTVTL